MFSFSDFEQNYGDKHPGLELVAVVPVGIPLHIYALDLTLYEAKEYPLLNEHLLRCLAIGLKSVKEISDFLGVSPDFVADAVAQEDTSVGTIAVAPSGALRLTDFGRVKLEDLTLNEARRSTEDVHVDLITGEVSFFSKIEISVDRLTKALDTLDGEEYVRRLEAQNTSPKATVDFSVERIDRLLTSSERMRKISVLEVLASKRTSRKPFYTLGQVLVYADKSGQRVMLNMSIDDELSSAHDWYLAQDGVRESLNINVEAAPELPKAGQIFQTTATLRSPRVVELVRKIEELPEELEVVEVNEKAPDGGGPKPTPMVRPSELGPSIFRAQRKPVRLKVTDMPRYRREALRFATKRLLIVSPWVKIFVVNDAFIDLLESALRRGVKVDIAIGFKDDLSDSHETAIDKLIGLCRKYPALMALHKWKSHEKVLIADQAYIDGSFNWLSFQGVDDKYYVRERGTLIVDPEIADDAYLELVEAFKAERDPNWP
jgi:hypothetical protein